MADTQTPTTAATVSVPEKTVAPETATETKAVESAGTEDVKKTEEPATAEEPTKAEETKAEEPAKSESAAKVEAAAEKATEEPAKIAEEKTPSTPFNDFAAKLPEIIEEIDYDEMWGVKLSTSPLESHIPTQIVLQKFLNANDGDLTKAIEQFKSALKWRKEKKPLELLEKTFNAKKFADLGLVTWYDVKDSSVPEVFTWNLYGNVKDKMDEVFVPLEEFLSYRIALQELGIKYLSISTATAPITATSDPYKMVQVHDYKSVSFFRQNPNVRAASTEVIKQFALVYPELLKEKFFVNVPAVMGWVYGVIKLFVAEKTRKKFHPMSNGENLTAEFVSGKEGWDAKKLLPKEYGGENGSGDGTLKGLEGNVTGLKLE